MQNDDLAFLTGQGLDVERRPDHIRCRLGCNLGNLIAERVAAQQCRAEHAVDEKIFDQAAGVFTDPDRDHGTAGNQVMSKRAETKNRLGQMKGRTIQQNGPDSVDH